MWCRNPACCRRGSPSSRFKIIAELAVATHARRAALGVVAPCTIKRYCTSKRPLSLGARPWCDVPAAASNTQPAFAWQTRGRVTALAVSLE